MKRHHAIIAICAILLAVAQIDAAPRINPNSAFGVGVGAYVGPDPSGYGYGGRFGFFPTYYRGFYGNGMSAYGPPVPTYGPIPGVFGASDYRVNQNPPIIGFGTGWLGRRSPSPRPVPNFDYIAPGNLLPAPQPVAVASEPCFRMEVHVPESARVFVEDKPTSQTGIVRQFESPPLVADEVYTYNVRAEWDDAGKVKSETRTVTGKPGAPHIIDFGK